MTQRCPFATGAGVALLMTTACLELTACSAGDNGTRAAIMYDTVGDTIVARMGAAAAQDTVSLIPEQVIGETDGDDDYMFGFIADVAVGTDNQVYVWEPQAKQIRMYDSSGTFVRRIGRDGAGPGEYNRVNGIAVRGDGKLVAWDAGNSRLNVYSAAGEHETQRTVSSSYFASRSLLADTASNVYLRTSVGRDTALLLGVMGLVRYASNGTSIDSILPPTTGAPPPQLIARAKDAATSYGIPYHPIPAWTISPFGYLVTTPGDPYVVHVHRNDGMPVRIVRETSPIAIDPAEREEHRAIALWGLRQTDPSYQWSGPDIPDRKPAIRGLMVDNDGRIWVSVAQPSERVPAEDLPAEPVRAGERPRRTWREPIAYDVFAPDGHFLGHVQMPRRATLFKSRGDRMWATTLDSMDVPAVTRFRMEPSLGGKR